MNKQKYTQGLASALHILEYHNDELLKSQKELKKTEQERENHIQSMSRFVPFKAGDIIIKDDYSYNVEGCPKVMYGSPSYRTESDPACLYVLVNVKNSHSSLTIRFIDMGKYTVLRNDPKPIYELIED